MPHESLPSPADAVQALAAEVAERIRSGEKPAAIREELVSQRIDHEVIEYILDAAAAAATSSVRTSVAMMLSVIVIIICSLGGFAGGVWVACKIPPAPGLAAMVTCLFSAVVLALGTVAGVAVGFGITEMLARWTASDRAEQ